MWAGQDWEPIAEMGRDVWTILTLKITGPGQLILDHADKLSPLCVVKASMAWFELVRETSGRFQDRKLVLSELVIDPKPVKTWGEVPEACRTWETHVWEHEELAGSSLDDSLKTSAFLKLLPPTLKELTQTQAGLQETFEHIRDYVLNQVGRRHHGPTHLRRTPEPKDDNAMDCSRLDHELSWDFGTGDTEEHNSTEHVYYTNSKGATKGGKSNWKGGKGWGKPGWRDARQRCYTCGSQDHLAAECPQGGKGGPRALRREESVTGAENQATLHGSAVPLPLKERGRGNTARSTASRPTQETPRQTQTRNTLTTRRTLTTQRTQKSL